MSLIGKKVLHKKYKDEGIVKNISVQYLKDSFKIILTIDYYIDYDILTYKTDFKEIMVI